MQGKIIEINKNIFTVKLSNGEIRNCTSRGKLIHDNIVLLVGDNVLITNDNNIEKLLPRKNELIRPNVSNIDKLFIVTSTHIPAFSTYLIDKFLALSFVNKIEPIIILTKLDKLSFKERLSIRKYITYYKKLGIKVYKNKQLSKIKKEFNNSTIALTGQTGAGKSTLLNMMDKSLNLETDEVSISLGRGKHTTRLTKLYELYGGMVADTPGFSSLELIGITKENIRDSFFEFSHDCKYKTCMHIKEDGCDVLPKVGSKIAKFRYDNYIKLLGGVKDEDKC